MNQPIISLSLPKFLTNLAMLSALLIIILFALGVLGGHEKDQAGTVETNGQTIPGGAPTLKLSLQTAAHALSWQGVIANNLQTRNADDLRLEAVIDEACASQVKQGMPATVRIDAIQQTLNGTIDEIAPETSQQSHSLLIKIHLPHALGLQSGQAGWLELGCQVEQQALLIPSSAILHYGELQAVKVLEGQKLHVQHIRTGKQYAAQIEVLSGLQAGDTILIQP